MATALMRRLPSDWQRTILVCGKCSKRVGGGFGGKGRTPLAKSLRRFLGLKKGRKARAGILEVRCLGICPRAAVLVVDAAAPGAWRLVKPGTPVEDVADELRLEHAHL